MDERWYNIALSMCPNLARGTLRKLLLSFGSAKAVWDAAPSAWQQHCRMRNETVALLDEWRRRFRDHTVEERLRSEGITIIVHGDDTYPVTLHHLSDEPRVLFVKGSMKALCNSTPVAIVGTRRASGYGLEAAKWVAETLASHGCAIVSGMAVGIDSAAHRAAIDSGGETIAVLGGGVDVCYPPSNRRLFQEIEQSGAIVSEYPPGVPVAKHHFPERNRIIAALGSILVVVQAGEKSGAMHTVDAALDLGHEVYVVPGPITSIHFRGSNQMLQQGAHVVLDPNDILEQLGLTARRVQTQPAVPLRLQPVYECLDVPKDAMAVANQLSASMPVVYSALLELEVGGLIHRLAGGFYQRN